MRRLFLFALVLVVPALAVGHISATSPGFANTTQEIVLGVGHGCEGADTWKVTTTIPSGVTSVRALPSEFGQPAVTVDGTGAVTSITWTRPDALLVASDVNYYKLALRARLPNTPFTTVYFPTEQSCKLADGGVAVSHWTDTSGLPPDGGAEPAPATVLLPARKAGWNKYTVPAAISNLALYFADAQIVWRGTSAYSANAAIAELISGTAGVNALTSLAASDVIWVKY